MRSGKAILPSLSPGSGEAPLPSEFLPDAKNNQTARVTKDELKNKSVRTDVEGHPTALHKPSAINQLKG